ncbi:MAG: U32 family peptidase [Clostridium sp.]|nr:U32 family peptidase [Clostridium sp.]
MKKIELLSPAGNFDALKGALNAGADAVYLGGGQYGARAYADNFPKEELLEGLRLAHILGKKIYLTVNTLVKEKELDKLYEFLLPFYESGLDGVIVQDLGVLRFIRKHFPSLALHASTQMTLTGSYGANLMKAEGVSRIVPARELSLTEIQKLKQDTGLEIEAFIHGAMCYCYSGQCLFSSILGGRSGNRGRCAQPCRLPYRIKIGAEIYPAGLHLAFDVNQSVKSSRNSLKGEIYPLSMRDMCTLEILPRLIDAGIDSFKIEGRMKKPAYAAGVTAIYRKYIDLYEKNGADYRVDEADLKMLHSLYIRSEVSDGYYKRGNGREMISLRSPSYSPTDEKLLSVIEKNYIEKKPCHEVNARIVLKAGTPAELTLWADGVSISCQGAFVQEAKKQPLREEKVAEQIQKTGNSLLKIKKVEVNLQGFVFMPVGALNELRRRAAAAMEEEIIHWRREQGQSTQTLLSSSFEAEPVDENQQFSVSSEKSTDKLTGKTGDSNQYVHVAQHRKLSNLETESLRGSGNFHVSVKTKPQLQAALEVQNAGLISRIYVEYSLLNSEVKNWEINGEIYAAAPYIVREKDICQLKKLAEAFSEKEIDGILIRNLESYGYLAGQIPSERLVIDANLYIWNREALSFWRGRAAEFYLPLECSRQEWRELLQAASKRPVNNPAEIKSSAVVYGRLPMMITANCLKKTTGKCNKKSDKHLPEPPHPFSPPEMVTLIDRYEKQFPVYTDCNCCYNVIYNSVPLSLHGMFAENPLKGKSENRIGVAAVESNRDIALPYDTLRLDFTTESGEDTLKTIRYFHDLQAGFREPFYKEYTTGHYKRGVE